MALSWASALGWRLHRHFLEGTRAESVEAVVDRLVALPWWLGDVDAAIRLRLAHPVGGEVAAAIAEGRVLITYAFRGATQVMTSSSASVHLAIRCAGRQWELKSWREYYGLEPEDWPRLRAVIREALSDGPLTQHELALAISKNRPYQHLISALEDKSHTLLKPLCWQGDLCFSPSEEGGARFRLLESVPGWTGLEELDDAGPLAIRAYLAAYGPATRDRIHAWLGRGLSAGRKRIERWIDGLAEELALLEIEGAESMCMADDAEAIANSDASEAVVLLPGSDQWVIGAGTSDTQIVPAEHRHVVTRGANLVIIGGRLHGTWKISRDTLQIVWLGGHHQAPPRSVDDAVTDLSAALGRELRRADS